MGLATFLNPDKKPISQWPKAEIYFKKTHINIPKESTALNPHKFSISSQGCCIDQIFDPNENFSNLSEFKIPTLGL